MHSNVQFRARQATFCGFVGAALPRNSHRCTCWPRGPIELYDGSLGSRHSPPGSGVVTHGALSAVARRIVESKVRIRSPAAERVVQTIGSSAVVPTRTVSRMTASGAERDGLAAAHHQPFGAPSVRGRARLVGRPPRNARQRPGDRTTAGPEWKPGPNLCQAAIVIPRMTVEPHPLVLYVVARIEPSSYSTDLSGTDHGGANRSATHEIPESSS